MWLFVGSTFGQLPRLQPFLKSISISVFVSVSVSVTVSFSFSIVAIMLIYLLLLGCNPKILLAGLERIAIVIKFSVTNADHSKMR